MQNHLTRILVNEFIYPAYIHSDTIHFMVEQEYRFFQSCGSCLYWGLGKYSLPLVGRPGLEPGEVKLPVLQTGPLPATVYRPILSYFWRVILDLNQDVYKTADLQKSF